MKHNGTVVIDFIVIDMSVVIRHRHGQYFLLTVTEITLIVLMLAVTRRLPILMVCKSTSIHIVDILLYFTSTTKIK